jgi:hypothetical protein
MSDEKERGVIFTPQTTEEGLVTEFPNIKEVEDKIIEVTPKSPEEIKAEIEAEVLAETQVEDGLTEKPDDTADDLDKKTYLKISSTFYVKPAGTEKNTEGEEIKLYKVLNPETNVVEKRPLTDVENHDIRVNSLKESQIKFHPIKNATKSVVVKEVPTVFGRKRKVRTEITLTHITTNQFDSTYRKKRQRKNKMQKASRRLARKS